MLRRSTARLPVALTVAVAAVLTSTMLGRPEGALFAGPWLVLLILSMVGRSAGGSAGRTDEVTSVGLELDDDRLVVGDRTRLTVAVQAARPGWVEVRPRPESAFWVGPADDDPAHPASFPSTAELTDTPHHDTARADTVGPERISRIECELAALAWGRHDVGRVDVRLHDRYGMFEWHGTVVDPKPVRVHPQTADLHRFVTPRRSRPMSGVHTSNAADRGIEFADIRTFGPGDSRREINWRASARAGQLLVSQRHPERATDVVLLVDSFVESGHDARTIVGLAIEAALALADSHLTINDRVGLIEIGGVLRWVTPATGWMQLHRLTDAVLGTRLYANATERDLSVLPRRALPPRSLIVALSPLLDPRFVDALYVLRGAGHDVLVVECVNRYVDQRRLRSGAADVAAAVFRAEQAVVRDGLTERGIAVGRWHRGQPLDLPLSQVAAARRRVTPVRG